MYKCARKCKRCRKLFVIRANNQKYCDDCRIEVNRERAARQRKDPRYRASQRRYWQRPTYKAKQSERYYARRKDKRWVAKDRKRKREYFRGKRRDPKYRAQESKSSAERQREIRLKFKRVLWTLQNGKCAVCLGPLSKSKLTHLDHDHSCREHGRFTPCPKCIRGLTHPTCNCTFLSIAERAPHLQSRHIKNYLSQRPLAKTLLNEENQIV